MEQKYKETKDKQATVFSITFIQLSSIKLLSSSLANSTLFDQLKLLSFTMVKLMWNTMTKTAKFKSQVRPGIEPGTFCV